MCFDEVLVKNKALSAAWRVAHGQNVPEASDINLTDLCDEIRMRSSSEHLDPRGRMSLRTSAVLINGAARIYKQQLQKLLDDCDAFEMEFIKRRKTCVDREITLSSPDSSLSHPTPEHVMQDARSQSVILDTSYPKSRKTRRDSPYMPRSVHSFSFRPHSSPLQEMADEQAYHQTPDLDLSNITDVSDTALPKRRKRRRSFYISQDDFREHSPANTADEEHAKPADETVQEKDQTKANETDEGLVPRKKSTLTLTYQATDSYRKSVTGAPDLKKSFIETGFPDESPLLSEDEQMSEEQDLSQLEESVLASSAPTSAPTLCCSVELPTDVIDEDSETTGPKTRDQAVQTSGPPRKRRAQPLYKTMPFACTMLYDNYNSRIPSKVLFYTVTRRMKKVLKL